MYGVLEPSGCPPQLVQSAGPVPGLGEAAGTTYAGHESNSSRHLAAGQRLVRDREGFTDTTGVHVDHRDEIQDEPLQRSVPGEPGEGVRLSESATGLAEPGGVVQQPAGHFPDLGHLGEALLVVPLNPPPLGLPDLHGSVGHVVPAVTIVVSEQPPHGVPYVGVWLSTGVLYGAAPRPLGLSRQLVPGHIEHQRERRQPSIRDAAPALPSGYLVTGQSGDVGDDT